jgi:hypothetical protein
VNRHERLFNAIGWIGFLILVPIAFYVLQFTAATDFMARRLGFAGRPVFLALLGFGLIFLRILFGGERSMLPLILGFVVGFLLVSTFARIGFMSWFTGLGETVIVLRNPGLSYFAGIGVLFLGMIFSYIPRFSFLVQLLTLIVLPVVALLVLNALRVLPA